MTNPKELLFDHVKLIMYTIKYEFQGLTTEYSNVLSTYTC